MSRMRLTTNCPQWSKCGQTNIKWQRKQCSHRTYIDRDGDLSCENKCSNPNTYYFIQEARFSCGSSTHETWVKFELTEIMQQLGMVIAGVCAGSKEEGVDTTFLANMLQNVQDKWKK